MGEEESDIVLPLGNHRNDITDGLDCARGFIGNHVATCDLPEQRAQAPKTSTICPAGLQRRLSRAQFEALFDGLEWQRMHGPRRVRRPTATA